MESIQRLPDETDEQLIYRVCSQKDAIGSWEDVGATLNNLLDRDYCAGTYRKHFTSFKSLFEANIDILTNGMNNELVRLRAELLKERVKISDERTAYMRLIRQQSRNDSIISLIKNSLSDDDFKGWERQDDTPIYNEETGKTLVVHLTDIHIGAVFNNAWNTYNLQVAEERLKSYAEQVCAIIVNEKPEKCIVALGGDLISGLIHFSTRMESNENVVEQIKSASIYIANFINRICCLVPVSVYSVCGNHGRAVADKKQSMPEENLDDLVLFYLNTYFTGYKNVEINYTNYNKGLNVFECYGHIYAMVHGDKDSNSSDVANNISLLIDAIPDVIITGHRHTNAITKNGTTTVLQSGSIMGCDNYAIDHRYCGEPEQWCFICDSTHPIKTLYPINFRK